uniref:interferon-stimulated 20 kDa exonuclease-like 2 n=1 Tax=Pristiophorus japonicus TaxID=55135 RepID=UPI00398E9D0F
MSDFTLNLDFSAAGPGRKPSAAGLKHKRFLSRRSYLERKGYLNKKQLGARAQDAGRRGTQTAAWAGGSQGVRPGQALLPGAPAGSPATALRSVCRDTQQWKLSSTSPSASPRHAFARGGGGTAPPPAGKAGPPGRGTAPPPPAPDRSLLLGESQSGLPPVASPAPGKPYKCVALDCEMVGTGPGGRRSELARCSVVGYEGDLVYDRFVLPPNPITDFRTRWSGVRRHHMRNATPFKLAQKEILKVLCGKVVVGHAVHNDFKALNYFHPQSMTRDTSKIPLLNRKAGFPEKESVSLKRLTKQLLHRDIQVGQPYPGACSPRVPGACSPRVPGACSPRVPGACSPPRPRSLLPPASPEPAPPASPEPAPPRVPGACSPRVPGACSPRVPGACSPRVPGACSPRVPGACSPRVPGACSPRVPGACSPRVPGACSPRVPGACPPRVPGACSPRVPGACSPR